MPHIVKPVARLLVAAPPFEYRRREVPVRSAISVLGTPSAANSMIRALVANPARTVEARVNASSRPRSPSRNSNASANTPIGHLN